MRKSQYTAEEQILRSYDQAADVESIDVRQPVMKAIADKYGAGATGAGPWNGGKSTSVMRPLHRDQAHAVKRWTSFHGNKARAAAASLLLVLSLGATYFIYTDHLSQSARITYTVKEYEPLEDPVTQFEIKLIETEPVPPMDPLSEEDKKQLEKVEQAKEWVEQQLLPGEVAFYLVGRDLSTKPRSATAVKPLHFDSYASFLSKQAELSAVELTEPGYLPEGYAFKAGQLNPFRSVPGQASTPSDKIEGSPGVNRIEAYDRFIKELISKPAQELGDDYRLVWSKLPAEGLDSAALSYSFGEQTLKIEAFSLIKRGVQVNKFGTAKTENIVVNGTELIYMEAPAEGSLDYTHRLYWLDSTAETYYSLSDSPSSSLSQQEMIRIAASMMGKDE
ncbi:hypothetical protein J7E73_12475 [Paenibacillus albidus]|uniref:hypothetical protein n=1 Tax=Paenibacillus albidus TaxID=2041023 RepID=UPI001BEB6FE0|nr:hypothetical protein [Paenibacillus albidus]MBT2289944.1 hypothetical protein [Paenibacillus albidus]